MAVRRMIATRWRVAIAEWLTLLAALLHLLAVPSHAQVWRGYATFFVVIALGQGLYSLLLPRLADRRWFLALGIIGTSGLLALWWWSRVWQTPVGPHRLHAEPFGILDVSVGIVEVIVLLCLADAYPRTAGRRRRHSQATEPSWT